MRSLPPARNVSCSPTTVIVSVVVLTFLLLSATGSVVVAAHTDADKVPNAAPIMTHKRRGASRFWRARREKV
ncbi:ferrichrome-iron receptor [Yersinia intermedia]|nr:ferrichrome-iron receptor [Yersinia sp. FDAARGOS_228]AVL34602.1 ferrichrome-iron receptor [Yersinia intermedia]OVZ76770.1 hypothetical protein CBW55_06630 [Yersinia intermedia]